MNKSYKNHFLIAGGLLLLTAAIGFNSYFRYDGSLATPLFVTICGIYVISVALKKIP